MGNVEVTDLREAFALKKTTTLKLQLLKYRKIFCFP